MTGVCMIFDRAGGELSGLDICISAVRVAVSTALERSLSRAVRFFPSTYRGCVCNVIESTDSRLDVRKMSGHGYKFLQIRRCCNTCCRVRSKLWYCLKSDFDPLFTCP